MYNKKRSIVLIIVFSILMNMSLIKAESAEISIGTDVYNLVTTFCGDAGAMRGFAW